MEGAFHEVTSHLKVDFKTESFCDSAPGIRLRMCSDLEH